jgi:hypothetical protein
MHRLHTTLYTLATLVVLGVIGSRFPAPRTPPNREISIGTGPATFPSASERTHPLPSAQPVATASENSASIRPALAPQTDANTVASRRDEPPRMTTRPSSPATRRVPSARLAAYFNSNPTPLWYRNLVWVDDGKGSSPDANGELLWIRNPQGHDYALAQGLLPAFFVANGTLNNAFVWADANGNARPMRLGPVGGLAPDWTKVANNENPPSARAMAALARLAKDPSLFKAPTPAAVVINIEHSPTMNVGADAPKADRRAAMTRWIDLVKVSKREGVRAAAWALVPYRYHAGAAADDSLDLERQLVAEQGEIWSGCYNANASAKRPDAWYEEVAKLDRIIASDFPDFHGRKVMTVCPTWAIYWNDKALMHLNGTLVDIETWRRQIRHLHDAGWEVCIWHADARFPAIKPHIDAVAEIYDTKKR